MDKIDLATIDINDSQEWEVTHFCPVIDQESSSEQSQTLLRAQYFDCNDRMIPSLKNGDHMILKRIESIMNWGAIHLIQTRGTNIVCRPGQSGSDELITLRFDDVTNAAHGQEIPAAAIIGIWELMASSRIHSGFM